MSSVSRSSPNRGTGCPAGMVWHTELLASLRDPATLRGLSLAKGRCMRPAWSFTVPVLSLLVTIACGGGTSPTSNPGPGSGSVIADGGHDATGEAATGACPAQAQVISGG